MLIIYSEDPNFKPIEFGTTYDDITYVNINDNSLFNSIDDTIYKLSGLPSHDFVHDSRIKDVIIKNVYTSYIYACSIIKGRWIDAEDIIGMSNMNCYYAKDVLKCRWSDIGKEWVEDIIGKCPDNAHRYAYYVLKCRWSDIGKEWVEDIIGRDPEQAYYYAKDVLHCRWADIGKPEVEDVIGKNPEWACLYAKDVLKKRWADIGKPEIEDVIGKDIIDSIYYAKDVIKHRWVYVGKPEIEDKINDEPYWANQYNGFFLWE